MKNDLKAENHTNKQVETSIQHAKISPRYHKTKRKFLQTADRL